MSSDIPPGWKLEKVSPPEQFKLPSSEKYRNGWDRIFGKKPTDKEERPDDASTDSDS